MFRRRRRLSQSKVDRLLHCDLSQLWHIWVSTLFQGDSPLSCFVVQRSVLVDTDSEGFIADAATEGVVTRGRVLNRERNKIPPFPLI